MNLVGLYFFSFLICGHLQCIKNSRHRNGATCVYEEQSLSAPSVMRLGCLLDLLEAPGKGVAVVLEGFLSLGIGRKAALDFAKPGVLWEFDELVDLSGK